MVFIAMTAYGEVLRYDENKMTEEEINRKIDFAKFVIDHNNDLITLADTKAGFILASAGVIMGLLFLMNKHGLTDFTKGGIIVTAILLGFTAIFSFIVILPSLTKKPPQTAIFFQSIVKKSQSGYVEDFKKLTKDEILTDYLNNIYNISKIQNKKFLLLQISLWFMIPALIALIITLFSYFYSWQPTLVS